MGKNSIVLSIAIGSVFFGACSPTSSSVTNRTDGSFDTSTAVDGVEATTTKPPDIGPNTPTGHVVLDGLPGASERCNSDGDRKVSVDWRGPGNDYNGPPLPLHISFTGAGGDHGQPHPFDWQAGAGLVGKDSLDGAFNIMIRFECMNSPDFPKLSSGPQAMSYLADLGMNPRDVNYAYELLCTDVHRDSTDSSKLDSIDTSQIDCTRVGLRGHSGGAFTAIMFLNECFEKMSITPNIRAIAGVVGGFFPFGGCSEPNGTGFKYRIDSGIPLFMKIACEDLRVPFAAYVRDQWKNMGAPKFLYSRSGGHSENDGPGGKEGATARLLLGEGLIQFFMRYYLLGDEGATGLMALDDFPDRPDLPRPEGVATSYQYDGPMGSKLNGGIC